jgi:hypothetical protein
MARAIHGGTNRPLSSSGNGDGGMGLLDFFIKREQVYNDFVRALGQYKLNVAQAELAEAQMANQIIRAMILDTVRLQLYTDLQRVNAEAKVAARRIHDVQVKVRYALHLLEGGPLSGSYGAVRDSYKYFETRVMIEADETLFGPLSLAGTEICGNNFLDNHDSDKACLDPKPADLSNALTLINWSFQMQYLARSGSPAMQQFVKLYKTIDSVAGKTVKQLSTYIDQIRKNSYDTWKPVMLAALDTSSAERSILMNTGPNKMPP